MPSLHNKRQLRRERKKIKRKVQGFILLSAFALSVAILTYNEMFKSKENENIDGGRHLLSNNDDDYDTNDDGYYINSLKEFPPNLFSLEEIRNGAWLLNFVGMFYCFLGIAIICDDYFVPAIEVIVDKLQLSEDVAGATFMAAGGSAPELFTSFVGVFLAKSDVGFGTIVGSAVFNVLFIIGACAIFTSGKLKLQWWPFARDMSYYLICLGMLAIFFGGISRNEMYWWESFILLSMYFIYVAIMYNNEKIKTIIYKRFTNGDDKQKLLKGSNSGYGTEREISMQKSSNFSSNNNNKNKSYDAETPRPDPVTEEQDDFDGAPQHSLNSTNGIRVKDDSDDDDDDDDDDNDSDESEEGLDLTFPDTTFGRIWYILKMPLTYPIYYTMFDVSIEDYVDWWPWTFFGSLAWLGGLAYLMVWWTVVVGYAWRVPQEVMGLVFLAAGTSVPELFSCIIVAKKGQADMAVSASIGSNIFDVLIGLPLPWISYSIIYGQPSGDLKIDVQAHGLLISILILILMLSSLLIIILYNKWYLTHCMGYSMIILYVVFVGQDLLRYYTPLGDAINF